MWWSSFTGSRGQERYECYVKFEEVQLSVEEFFQLLDYTAISIKVVGENGECQYRTEVTRLKGTVITLFDKQNFIGCVHLALK